MGQIRGDNLFHSFHDFNVATGSRVTFTGPNHIDNILSRVTGGRASLINGTLSSAIDGANLFLLNPSGVLFGPGAALDVSGSFHVSTADQLHFSDGDVLATGQPVASGLSVADPAFGFLGDHPAGIAILGSELMVEPHEHLSVTGGDLTMAGGVLVAPQGHIQVVSVASEAKIDGIGAPQMTMSTLPARMGDIVLTNGALIDTSDEGGGTVVMQGRHLTLDHALISAETHGREPGGSIDVTVTGRLTIIGSESGLSTTT